MSLTFLNPLFLLGLAAAILPVLIHRITRKKAAVRKFSAVRLLLQSERVTARPRRLKHLLLLALRILAVATIVFMMARPVLDRPGFAALLKRGAKVLILDNSLSMGYREDRGERFQVAKRAAKEALEGFEGQVAIIPTVSVQTRESSRWMKPEEASRELEAIPLSFGRGNTESALASAYQQLKGLRIPKQVLILSDMARSDWQSLDLTKLVAIPDADITFLRIGGPGRDSNACIKDVSLQGGDIVAGVPTPLEVTVLNYSDQSGQALVQVSLSGTKVDQKSIDLKPGQEGKVVFDILVEKPGWVDGEIQLSPDRLSSDDVFYVSMKVREKVKVLVVDGDPRTSLKASESYYLVSALVPGGYEGSPFLTRVITESEAPRVKPRSYDAIFLLNVARPDFAELASVLEMGKPVFIFLGDRIVPEVYNRFALAPWQIREMNDLSGGSEKIAHIDSKGRTPEFLARLESSLRSASFRTYYRVEGSARNLIELGNRDPLLAETDAAKSKIFLFTSSADVDWNDLPLKAAYLPLIQGLLKEAIGLTGASPAAGTRVGEPFREESQPVQIRGPQGGPGIFQFHLPTGELRRSVNTPPEESDLAKVSEDELKKKFGAVRVQVVEYKEGALREFQGEEKELWPSLLGFLLVILALEMILANGLLRFKRT
jgi:Aerotolerance regulator N-terminal/von Willebrand factor type A domain